MASNNSKYSPEMREQTAAFIIDSGKSATSVAEELGIDVNTVCRWVRDYRRRHNLPSYAEEKGIGQKGPKSDDEWKWKCRQIERQLKEKDAELKAVKKKYEESQEATEILKKSLRIFMQPHE